MYDYLIIGAGLFGAVCAYKAAGRGKTCLVIDRRRHIGGNVYSENIDGVTVHKYGAHIFHTNEREIWEFITKFADFNRFTNAPVANYNGEIYNLPFNMNTFYKLWGVTTPQQAKAAAESRRIHIENPQNLEEQALALVGADIYEKLIKGYTEKQWGRPCRELPAFIIKRLPLRFTYDNAYFNDRYQGVPEGGYTQIIEKLLERSDVRLNTDFFDDRQGLRSMAKNIIYTGMIDEYFNYQFGALEYRSLRFDTETLPVPNYQGNAVVNYTSAQIPYTRIIEHKHFEYGNQANTVITREFPEPWTPGKEPYYPVNDDKNNALFAEYRKLAQREENVFFGGRLASYRYMDMWQVIAEALLFLKEK